MPVSFVGGTALFPGLRVDWAIDWYSCCCVLLGFFIPDYRYGSNSGAINVSKVHSPIATAILISGWAEITTGAEIGSFDRFIDSMPVQSWAERRDKGMAKR